MHGRSRFVRDKRSHCVLKLRGNTENWKISISVYWLERGHSRRCSGVVVFRFHTDHLGAHHDHPTWLLPAICHGVIYRISFTPSHEVREINFRMPLKQWKRQYETCLTSFRGPGILDPAWVFYVLTVNKVYRFVTMVHSYNYHNSGHYPSSCLLFINQLNSTGVSVPHRKHYISATSPTG
jgi:hypothetical protein